MQLFPASLRNRGQTPEAILLIDAENALNNLNQKLALDNIQKLPVSSYFVD